MTRQDFFHYMRQIRNFIARINAYGKQRFTIMIIPHSEKDIKNIHISNFRIISLLSLTAVIVLVSCFYLLTYTVKSKNLSKLVYFKENTKRFISIYEKETREMGNSMQELKNEVADFVADPALKRLRLNKLMGIGGTDVPLEKMNSKVINNEMKKYKERILTENIENNNVFLQYSGEVIKKVSGFIIKREDFLRNFPNIWPVYYGNGYTHRYFKYKRDKDIKIRTMPGIKIIACGDGEVESVTYDSHNRYTLVISHGFGFFSTYKNLHYVMVKECAEVKKGDIIAISPGEFSFRVRIASESVDPLQFSSMKY